MAEGGNGVARWGAWASAVGTAAVILGAMFVLYSQVSTAYAKANDLEGRVDRLSAELTDERNKVTQICSSLVEVETQFRASDQVRNLMHVNDLRTQAMLWRKSFGADYPVGDAYLPTIAQERASPCG